MKYKNNEETRYFRKQKILGAVLALLGILTAIIFDGDITVAVMLVPLGLGVMFTKDRVLLNNYFYDQEDKNEES